MRNQVVAVPIGEAKEFDAPLRNSSYWWWFAQGVSGGLFVRIIGSLSMLEVYLLATFPIRAAQVLRLACSRGVVLFTVLWGGWMLGAVMADMVNQSDWSLAARGFSRAFFAGFVTLCMLACWLRTPRGFDAFLAGTPLALLIGLKYFRAGSYAIGDGSAMVDSSQMGWDIWGNYMATSIVTALIARFWRTRPWACVAMSLGIGAINIAMGSRSAGTMQVLAGMILPFFILRPKINWSTWRIGRGRLRLGTLMIVAVVGAVSLLVVSKTYSTLAAAGLLGEKAQAKYISQSSAKGGILVGGRAEVVIGLTAVLDKPITGHGSWPEDKVGYAEKASNLFGVEIREPKLPPNSLKRRFIKAHSAIVSAWLDHGILGAIFWMYVLYLVSTNFWRVTEYIPEYTGVVVFNSCGFFWHFFFSPIQARTYTAIILVPILIIQIRRLQSPKKAALALPTKPVTSRMLASA